MTSLNNHQKIELIRRLLQAMNDENASETIAEIASICTVRLRNFAVQHQVAEFDNDGMYSTQSPDRSIGL